MSITIYSAPGCLRCKILKQFLTDAGRSFEDFDGLGAAKERFKAFYRDNRDRIHRGPDGVEFPILYEGETLKQGLPMALGYLVAGPALDGFFRPGLLHRQWIDGIHVSGGDPAQSQAFIEVLIFLKKQNLKLEIETDGLNAALLGQVLEQRLADRVVMQVRGPAELYASLTPRIDMAEVKKSIALVASSESYHFYTIIAPVVREMADGEQAGYISPEETGAAAELIKVAAGDSRQPYYLKAFDPRTAADERLKEFEPLSKNELFKYRTMARKHQFKTELG
jgi:pyruvate formate lyase activating enzyme